MRIVRDLIIVLIACFFAVMWGLMIRENLANPGTSGAKPDYTALLDEGQKSRQITMGIYRGNVRIGQTRSNIQRDQNGIRVQNMTELRLGDMLSYLAPDLDELRIKSTADISEIVGLKTVSVHCPQLDVRVQGVVRDKRLKLGGIVAGQKISRDIFLGNRPMLTEALSPLSRLPNLSTASPGDRWTMHVLNPLVGGVQAVRLTLVATHERRVNQKPTILHQLSFSAGSRRWGACIDADGRVLAQGTPVGLTLRREGMSEELRRFVRRTCLGSQQGK